MNMVIWFVNLCFGCDDFVFFWYFDELVEINCCKNVESSICLEKFKIFLLVVEVGI